MVCFGLYYFTKVWYHNDLLANLLLIFTIVYSTGIGLGGLAFFYIDIRVKRSTLEEGEW